MKPSLLLILTVFLLPACGSSVDKNSVDLPNILFIMSDDHTSQAISAYGGMLTSVCTTPNIDRIATGGMLFKNCFVTNSICSPSRAAIMTGKYSHKNGVYKFTALDYRQNTLPKIMKQAGYHTALIGKYHLHSNPVGLDYFEVLPGQGDYYNPELLAIGDEHPSGWVLQGRMTSYRGHSSDVIADRTLEYLKQQKDSKQPFILFCHFKAPHDPWEYAERYEDFLENIEIPEPANLFDDYEGREALKTTLQFIGSEWGGYTSFEEQTSALKGNDKKKMQYQLYMKKYLRCVKGVDDNVGRILQYLDKSGLAENTMVVYTGDQGFFLGEHGLYDKRFMYEEALRMPFLIRWPGHIEKGSVSEGMILNVDFAPTLMEAAGLDPEPDMQGRSFLPLTRGNLPPDWRQSMYYRYYYSHFKTEPHYGIRTHTHKLIHFNRNGQWELYDLVNDPQEMHNCYDEPDYQSIVEILKKELSQLQKDLGDHPEDVGDHPNIGELAARPLHVARHVDLENGNKTVLVRFRSRDGGTLFSTGNLEDGPREWWDEDVHYQALLIRESTLVYFDGEEDHPLKGLGNKQDWHTAALCLEEGQPLIYLDGKRISSDGLAIKRKGPPQNFNIGAGMDEHGFSGYNFIGEISIVLIYDQLLQQESIESFAHGTVPEDRLILSWSSLSL